VRKFEVPLRVTAGTLSLLLLLAAVGALSATADPEQDSTDLTYVLVSVVFGVPGLVMAWFALRGWRASRAFVLVLLSTTAGALIAGTVQMLVGTQQACSFGPSGCGGVEHFQGDFTGIGMAVGAIVGFACVAAWGLTRRGHTHT
jgi:hypothetical protein